MRCPVCGNMNREGARFCDACGTRLERTADGPASDPETRAAALPVDAPAEIAGRYEVLSFLGRGGRKRVYRARDREADGREVAIAVFETAGIGETAAARARREAQAMERLGRHPRIVSVLSSGEHEGTPFLVSEYMAGGDVRSLLADSDSGRFPAERAIPIAADICRALEHAHGHGIVHRDLKPGNVWIGDDGRARLGDFGLAATERRSREAVEGLIGTVAYLPPEQALGRPVDARADLYSLGALLYEMITGRPPFTGDDAVAIIGRHVNSAPVPPRRVEPSVPVALDRLILELLAKSPDDRPASAAETRATLEAIAANPDAEPAEEFDDAPLDLGGGALVGRERELEQLREAVGDALRGRGNMLLLVGEPGIGKTRAAEELSTFARVRGARVLWGHCHDGDRAPAYWPWIEALREFAREADPVGLRWQLGARGPELARIVPEIAELLGRPAVPVDDDEHGRFRLFDAVAGFLVEASRARPLVVVLEDLHWADASALELLKFTARQLAESGLLIVGTYRDVELGEHHVPAAALGELETFERTGRIHLDGLDPNGVARMIEASTGRVPPDALVRAIHERTDGNPFFVGEVVRLLAAEGMLASRSAELPVVIPRGARETVARRLDRLTTEANELLKVAAVAGREFEPAMLELASGRTSGEIAAALRAALAAKLVSARATAAGWFSFAHAIVRETIYAGIEPAERARLNGRVGEATETLHRDQLDDFLDDLARHFADAGSAGDAEKAIDFAVRAARRATAKLAHEDAANHYARALELIAAEDRARRLDLELALGRSSALGGRFVEAREAFERAADLAREQDSITGLCRAALGISLVAVTGSVDEPLLGLLHEALDAVGPEDSVARVELLSAIAGREIWRDLHGAAAEAGREAAEIARRLGDDHALAVSLSAHQFLFAGAPDSPRRRLENAEELIEVAGRSGDAELAVRGHAYKLHALLELGRVAEADDAYRDYARIAHELRQPQHLWHLPLFRAVRETMHGHFDEAERLAKEARRGGERAQEPLAEQLYALQMTILRQHQGRLEEVVPAVREMAARFPAIEAWTLTLAGLLAELGGKEEAEAQFARLAARDFADLRQDLQWLPAIVRLVETCHWLGDAARAEVLDQRLAPFSGLAVIVGRAAACQGPVDLHLGRLALTMGRADEAVRRFEAAGDLATRMEDRVSALESRYGLGRALADRGGAGDRERALEELTASLDGAEAIGMRRLVERALAARLEVQGLADIDVLTSIEAVVEAVGSERPDLSALASGEGTLTILFSDIENSTLINERLGDARWLELLREHNAVFRRRLDQHGGYEVKSQGDGFMLAFGDPAAALAFAIEVQADLAESAAAGTEGISVRMGLHNGEAIAEEGDLFGRSVVLAARIAAQARGGEILASEALERSCAGGEGSDYRFRDPRELELKGLSGTHRVYAVEPGRLAPSRAEQERLSPNLTDEGGLTRSPAGRSAG